MIPPVLSRKWLLVLFAFLPALALFCITARQSEAAKTLAPSAASPSPSTSPSPENIVVTAVGDIMLGSTYPASRGLPPQDGATMLRDVTPLLTPGDITFGNLEGPMLEGGSTSKCRPDSRSCFAFRVPTRYGRYLKEAGFNLMSLANNHASDFGAEGRESTRRVLDRLGIAHAGGDRNDIPYLKVKGRRIAVVAFAFNNVSYNVNDIEAAKRVVERVKAKSDLVLVSFHAGAEGAAAQHVPHGTEIFLDEPRGDSRAFTHAVIDAGADLLLGSGPHVVRGMEVYRNRLIVYSLGNFAFHGFGFNGPTGLSVVLAVDVAADGRFLGGRIYPLKEGQDGPYKDKAGAIIPIVRQLSRDDFGASAVKIGDDGAISPP